MKRIIAATAALALGATLGAVGVGTWALWSDQASRSAELGGGGIDFAVGAGTPQTLSAPPVMRAIEADGDGRVTLSLGAALGGASVSPLADGQTHVVGIRVDGQSQGNRGLSYRLDDIAAVGEDTGLLSALNLVIVRVPALAECSARALADPAAVTAYSGPLLGAGITDRTLVSAAYSTASWDAPASEYLCLGLSASGVGTYTNTVQASGDAVTSRGTREAVSAEDSWSARLGYSDADRDADATLTFSAQTFRAPIGH